MRGLRWDLNPSWDVRIVQVESTWDSTQELFLHGLELNMIKRQVITETDFVSGTSDIIIPMSEMRHFIFLLELFGCHIKIFLLNRFVVSTRFLTTFRSDKILSYSALICEWK